MPYGARRRVHASGPSWAPRLVPTRQGTGGPVLEMGRADPGAPAGQWDHQTLSAADVAAGVTIAFPEPATRVIVQERGGQVVTVGFGAVPGTTEGTYDLLHPGNGEIDRSIPPTNVLGFKSSAPSANAIEVWVTSGYYADRPT
jgi:hypothetical protein